MLLWQNSTHKQYAFNTTIHLTNSIINHASQRLHSHDDMWRTTVIYAVTYASTVMIDNAMDTTINDNWCIAYARCPYHIIRRDGWQRYSLIHVHHEKWNIMPQNIDVVTLERGAASCLHNNPLYFIWYWIWTMNCIIGPSGWLFDCMLLGSNEWWGTYHFFDTAPDTSWVKSGLHELVSGDGDMENDGRCEFPSPITSNQRWTMHLLMSPSIF
jgi:hypothetical protein